VYEENKPGPFLPAARRTIVFSYRTAPLFFL